MAVSLTPKSRLRFGELLISEDVEFFDILDLPIIPIQEDDIQYQVQGGLGERIDRLSTRFYGSPNLWWVIATSNDMEIVPTDLSEGDIIRIPSPRYVLQELFK